MFTAGQLPLLDDGRLAAEGKVGVDLDIEMAARAAGLCALNAVPAICELPGGPDRIEQIVKVVGFVAAPSDFDQHPAVVDGASTQLLEMFGERIGRHSRSAVGVSALPRNAPVEVELIARITDA